ncbi:hypothetical protein BofuT4_uP101710.1 [Botrytis cinerea T4]|uniref:Uncharacterized protein n=1 Tax=Botryotinia fuckeliana (strain T4) TaxID=999810 RepID=G2YBI1_BOTF4|nr:hypothetical protein BofuT4_uP101710.1 [Botrytis cinerea T4]
MLTCKRRLGTKALALSSLTRTTMLGFTQLPTRTSGIWNIGDDIQTVINIWT